MKRFLFATTLIALPLAALAAPVTGDINFDGSNSYTSSTVTFINPAGATSDTGTLASFGTCTSCITVKNITWAPYSGSLAGFISGTNNGVTLDIDLGSLTSSSFTPNVDLDLDFAATLNETGFAATPGTLFFSTQGPNGIEVSFSATALAVPEPASLAILGIGLLGLGAYRLLPRKHAT